MTAFQRFSTHGSCHGLHRQNQRIPSSGGPPAAQRVFATVRRAFVFARLAVAKSLEIVLGSQDPWTGSTRRRRELIRRLGKNWAIPVQLLGALKVQAVSDSNPTAGTDPPRLAVAGNSNFTSYKRSCGARWAEQDSCAALSARLPPEGLRTRGAGRGRETASLPELQDEAVAQGAAAPAAFPRFARHHRYAARSRWRPAGRRAAHAPPRGLAAHGERLHARRPRRSARRSRAAAAACPHCVPAARI